jgi:hypothetical protein
MPGCKAKSDPVRLIPDPKLTPPKKKPSEPPDKEVVPKQRYPLAASAPPAGRSHAAQKTIALDQQRAPARAGRGPPRCRRAPQRHDLVVVAHRILRSGSWMKSVIAGRASGRFFSGLGRGCFASSGSKIADQPQRKWRPAAEKPEHYTARRGSEARIVTRPSEFLGPARKNNRARQ